MAFSLIETMRIVIDPVHKAVGASMCFIGQIFAGSPFADVISSVQKGKGMFSDVAATENARLDLLDFIRARQLQGDLPKTTNGWALG